jgi:hypothetical protein
MRPLRRSKATSWRKKTSIPRIVKVVAIEALASLGRRVEASRRAAAFTSAPPESGYRLRIARALGD